MHRRGQRDEQDDGYKNSESGSTESGVKIENGYMVDYWVNAVLRQEVLLVPLLLITLLDNSSSCGAVSAYYISSRKKMQMAVRSRRAGTRV
jgi:hypothetical protein